MKTLVFLTSQTSATASITRMIRTINKDQRKFNRFFGETREKLGFDAVQDAIIPQNDQIAIFNFPSAFNVNSNLANYDFMVNFRDPRDRICNLFHWTQTHPTKETDERREERQRKVLEKGIDAWVRDAIKRCIKDDRKEDNIGNNYYDRLFWVLDNADSAEAITYARLCIDFDSFIEKLTNKMQIELTPELRAELEPERTDDIAANQSWIGNQWAGADTMPGRYKRELAPETIDFITEYYAPILKKMAHHDADYASYYSIDR